MPPYIYNKDDEGFLKPFQYLHPGIRKPIFPKEIHQPHVFQQSVTLTASMWNEVKAKNFHFRPKNDSKGTLGWGFDSFRVLGKYSPLFIGLVCGFVIVLLIMSTVMLWRYCLISATKKVCCKGGYGEINQCQKSLPLRNETAHSKSENFQNKFSSVERLHSPLQRSATVGSLSLYNDVGKKPLYKDVSTNNNFQHLVQPLTSADLYTSHLYLQKLGSTSDETVKSFSKSTLALEDLYAKVNFSKKKKNRMRKNEAAIIAMSKSHSGENNSLELFGSAIVVYNERTAL